jgi:hypothetical protein
VPEDLGEMAYERSDVTLSHEVAAALLRSDAHTVSGPRPQFLTGAVYMAKGRLFKDDCLRRDRGTDRYKFKGGNNNRAFSAVLATTASGKEVRVKRGYGSVSTKQLPSTRDAVAAAAAAGAAGGDSGEESAGDDEEDEGGGFAVLKVHQYCFHVDGKDEWPRLFHIQPEEVASPAAGDQKQLKTKAQGKAAGAGGSAKSAKPAAAQPRTARGGRGGAGRDRGRGGAAAKREQRGSSSRGSGGGGGGEDLQREVPAPQPVQQKERQSLAADGAISGPLKLTNADETSPFITFHHHATGKVVGSIQPSDGGRGVKLETGAGDFAEVRDVRFFLNFLVKNDDSPRQTRDKTQGKITRNTACHTVASASPRSGAL